MDPNAEFKSMIEEFDQRKLSVLEMLVKILGFVSRNPSFRDKFGCYWAYPDVICFHPLKLAQVLKIQQVKRLFYVVYGFEHEKNLDGKISNLKKTSSAWHFTYSSRFHFNQNTTEEDVRNIYLQFGFSFKIKEELQQFQIPLGDQEKIVALISKQKSFLSEHLHSFLMFLAPIWCSNDKILLSQLSEKLYGKYDHANILEKVVFGTSSGNPSSVEVSCYQFFSKIAQYGSERFLLELFDQNSSAISGFSLNESPHMAANRVQESHHGWLLVPDATQIGFWFFAKNQRGFFGLHFYVVRGSVADEDQIISFNSGSSIPATMVNLLKTGHISREDCLLPPTGIRLCW